MRKRAEYVVMARLCQGKPRALVPKIILVRHQQQADAPAEESWLPVLHEIALGRHNEEKQRSNKEGS